MFKTRLFIILLLLVTCLAILSGCNQIGSTTAPTPASANSNATMTTGTYTLPTITDRTTWNIEMKLVKFADGVIIIEIRDNDNLGYRFNDKYFELEILKDNGWVKISSMNEAFAVGTTYAIPDEKRGYITSWSYNRTAFMPGVTLETGHYRLTKILSGKKISCEFDLVID